MSLRALGDWLVLVFMGGDLWVFFFFYKKFISWYKVLFQKQGDKGKNDS